MTGLFFKDFGAGAEIVVVVAGVVVPDLELAVVPVGSGNVAVVSTRTRY